MNENDPSSQPPVLNYDAPSRRRGNPILGTVATVMGVCAGLFGAVMLFNGIDAIIYASTGSNRVDFAGDLFGPVMFLLIGVVCLYVAVRWCRAAPGIISGKVRVAS